MRPVVIAACVLAVCLPGLGGCGTDEPVGVYSGACGGPAAEPGPDGCLLVCRASLPVRFQNGTPRVTVWINDTPIDLLLDTGAVTTSLTGATASSLGLAAPEPAAGEVTGVGGAQARRTVEVASLAFGAIRTGPRSLDVLEAARPVSEAPGLAAPGGLGMDVLGAYDIDLDLPHGTVRLYQGRACPGPPPGWRKTGIVLPNQTASANGLAVVPVRLDEEPALALIDTGSDRSGVSTRLVARLPATSGEAEMEAETRTVSAGYGSAIAPGRLHRFASFGAGADYLTGFEADILDLRLRRIDILLGDDYLRRRRLFLSRTEVVIDRDP